MKYHETVAVVGLGYVGLPLALLADDKGYKVIGIDVDAAKIELLKEGKSPFAGHVKHKEIQQASVSYSADFAAVKTAEIIVICVPTPVDKNSLPDLSLVESASAKVAAQLRPGQLIILESTVNPGVSESVVLKTLESVSGLVGGRDFHLAHCPERINPGDKSWSVANIPRVVGAIDAAGLDRTVEFYRSIVSGEIRPMANIREAEAVKVVENSFRDINIAFVNELAMSFDKLGISVVNVINGASTKPFAFMPHFPGCGVGGHCIPVDPYYLIEYARANGFTHEFLALARTINRRMPKYTADLAAGLLKTAGTEVKGARVAVLGLAYKGDIGDTRESPSFEIVDALEEMGAHVVTYDPYVKTSQRAAAPTKLASIGASDEPTTVTTGYELFEQIGAADGPLAQAIEGVDALVIATNHRIFRETDPAVFARAGVKVIVDGRNCLDRGSIESLGMLYKGIGH